MKKLIKTYNGNGTHKVLILSGIHGNELTSVFTSMEINKYANEFTNYCKKLTVVIGYSEQAIMEDTIILEGKRYVGFDVNREIELNPQLEDLRRLIKNHDVVIDLHSSWNCSPFVLIDNNKYADKLLNWCIEAKVPYFVQDFNDTGTTIKTYALNQGKLGITFEMGGMNKIDHAQPPVVFEYIKQLLQGLQTINDRTKYKIKNAYSIFAKTSGIVEQIEDLGEFVENDVIVSRIIDYEFKVLEEQKTSEAGFLLCGIDKDFVNEGETVFLVQPTIR